MNLLRMRESKATVVVGLDFGTTFSGFAYALTSEPEDCKLFYEWPYLKEASASNYCTTQTSLLYSSVAGGSSSSEPYVLQGWGHEALVLHAQCKQSQHNKQKKCDQGESSFGKRNVAITTTTLSGESEHFITRFKLHLARSGETSAADLSNGLTPRRTISDYLRRLAELIISELQGSLGNHITVEDIQWCITVPAIWDEEAKQEMKTCAEIAGLVQGPHCKDRDASPHPAIIVLEPEAASFYCQQLSDFPLDEGDMFLVVDAGGGTVDLALHEKAGPPWSQNVREVAPSSGGLCGGTYVDEGFSELLRRKIRCFAKFAAENSQTVLKLQLWWETIKRNFDGNMRFDYVLELPAKLARAWEEDDSDSGRSNACMASYDSIVLTLDDMFSIFDPVVDQILELIDDKLIPNVKAMMVVGGFAASPYLKNRIKVAFSGRLATGTIMFPKKPGSAICCGAVAYGVSGPDLVMSRISKKTYGIDVARLFRQSDPEHMMFPYNGSAFCRDTFKVFTRKGETVLVDCCVSHTVQPMYDDQTQCRVSLFSTSDTEPNYVTDRGIFKEGSFVVHHPSKDELGETPNIKVSMYFGRTTIDVKAEGENFEGENFEMPPVTFERSFVRLNV